MYCEVRRSVSFFLKKKEGEEEEEEDGTTAKRGLPQKDLSHVTCHAIFLGDRDAQRAFERSRHKIVPDIRVG